MHAPVSGPSPAYAARHGQKLPEFDPEAIFEVLDKHGVRYIVIGAIAAIAQGYPLNTGDLDVTPASDPDNLERLAAALVELEARLRVAREPAGIEFAIEPEYLRRAESWTLTTMFGNFDLCFVPAGTRGFDDLRRNAVAVRIRDIDVQVAGLLDVIRMKEAAGRPKDLAQLPALRQTVEVARDRERRTQS
jgi:hypothetical protein